MRPRRAVFVLALSTALLGACASDPRTPFTESEEMTAVAIGAPNIRYWADATASSAVQGVSATRRRAERATVRLSRAVRRRRGRRLRRGRSQRLERVRDAAGIHHRVGRVDRGADRSLRLSRTRLRRQAQANLHERRGATLDWTAQSSRSAVRLRGVRSRARCAGWSSAISTTISSGRSRARIKRGVACWSSRPISTRSAPSSGTWAPSRQAASRKPLNCSATFSPPPRAFPWSSRRN